MDRPQSPARKLSAISAAFCIAAIFPIPALSAKLPDNGPTPRILRPAVGAQVNSVSEDKIVLPETNIPVPEMKPVFPADAPDAGKNETQRAMLPDRRSDILPGSRGLPEAERECRLRLSEMGVSFNDEEALSDPDGCSVPYPITVSSLGTKFELQPKAVMNCATAEAVARFAKDTISPIGQEVFGSALKSISQASAYVCRPRAGTRKLSEHAFGNAFDVIAFDLEDGTTVTVASDVPEKHGAFLDKVRTAACGPFKTVLGPGSDADHSDHFHLDLAPRRNGGTFCQ